MDRRSGGIPRTANTSTRLERREISRTHQRKETMSRQSGRGLSDLRHVLHVLRSSLSHIHTLLEDIPNGTDAHPQKGNALSDRREGDENQQQQQSYQRVPHETEVPQIKEVQKQEIFRSGSVGFFSGDDGGSEHNHDGHSGRGT